MTPMSSVLRAVLLATPSVLMLASPAQAGSVTTARAPVGGPMSSSSEGFDNPGLLADGITPAAAGMDFSLNTNTNQLTLVVENTSPVTTGIPNPLLTRIYFNAPIEVTGMTLATQTGSGGAAPHFSLTFDSNVFSNPNPNTAGPFGAFSAELRTGPGVQGGIASASADTIPGSSGAAVIGPVTFVFNLTGTLTGLTASDFAHTASVNPPGDTPSNTAGHFQAGGVASASAYINNFLEPCYLITSYSPGNGQLMGPPPYEHVFPIQLRSPRLFALSLQSPLKIPLNPGRKPFSSVTALGPGGLSSGSSLFGEQVEHFKVQALMWNPIDFPANPEQYSFGVDVIVWSSGAVTTQSFGTNHGMVVSPELGYTAEGRPYLRFPFVLNHF